MTDTPKPTDRTVQRICDASRLLAVGFSYETTAQQLGVSYATVCYLKSTYPTLWQAAHDQAMQNSVESIRRIAGTDRVIADVPAYLVAAGRCDAWTAERGEPLFKSNGEPTLVSFYKNTFVPIRLADVAPSTRQQMDIAVRRWRLLSGDPPLRSITSATLAHFKHALSQCRGLQPHLKASPTTVAAKLAMIQSILDLAGPPSPKSRDSVGILAIVPWIKPPQKRLRPIRIVTEEEINVLMTATALMETPRLPGIKPGPWWRAVLMTAWCTGLRAGTLFALPMTAIDWERKRVSVPAAILKSRRPLTLPVTDGLLDALRRIRTDRELVFPWPLCRRQLFYHFHCLQDFAFIPRAEQFGFHAFRKTLATRMTEAGNLDAARFMLGHAASDITANHYVDPDGLVCRALESLPVPEAFRNGNGEKGDETE